MPTGTADPLLSYEALNPGADLGQDTEPDSAKKPETDPVEQARFIGEIGKNIGGYRDLFINTPSDNRDSDMRRAA